MADAAFDSIINSQIKATTANTAAIAANTTAITPLTSAMTSLVRALTINSAATISAAARIAKAQTAQVATPSLGSLFGLLRYQFNRIPGIINKLSFSVGFGAAIIHGSLQAAGHYLAKFGIAVAKVAAVVYAASKTVQLLNPGIVEVFNTSIRDLGATVGVAFQSMIPVITNIVNQIAGALLPVMQALAPVFEQLARTIGSVLVPIVQLIASVLEALAPILKIIADIFEILGTVFKVVIDVISLVLTPVLEAISLIFQALEPILELVAIAFKVVAEVIGVFISAIKAAIRFLSFGLLGNSKSGKGATAVPNEPPTIDAISSIGNKIAQMAATSQSKESKADNYLKRIAEGVEQLTRGKGFDGFKKALDKHNPFTNPSYTNSDGKGKSPIDIGLGIISGLGMGGLLPLVLPEKKGE